jgi:hypothetical protein
MAEVREYSLKLTTEQAQQNIDELNKSLQAQEDLLFDIDKELRDYEKQLSKTSATDLAKRQHLNDKIKETKARLKEEQSGLKDLNQERKLANREMDESIEASAEYDGVLGMLDSKTGGAISGFTGMTKSIGAATKGFNLMKIAIIGTGIGALLIALTALGQAFTSSEEGQNAWSKTMGVLGAVVDVFTDRLAALGRFLINLFTSPIETLKNFGKSIKEFVMDKVEKVIEGLGFMGKAISKLFKGDFAGAMDAGKQGLKSLNDGLNVAKMATDALAKGTKELIKEIEREAKIAAKIADDRAKAAKLERGIIVERAEADKQRATLLEQAVNKEKYTLGERIEFLVEAGRLEDEITAKEIEAAKLRLQAKIAENALGDSTIESLEEEAQLKAALIGLETAKVTKAKEVTSQIIGLRNEERAASKARYEEQKANEQAIVDFKKSLLIEDKNNQFAAIEEERANRIAELKELKASEIEKQKMLLDIQKSFDNQKKIIEEENQKAIQDFKDSLILKEEETKFTQIEKEREANLLALEELKLTEEAKQQMILDVENAFKEKKKIIEEEEAELLAEEKEAFLEAKLGEEEATLEEQKAADLLELKRVGGTEADKLAIIKYYNDQEEAAEEIKNKAELDMAQQTFAGVANLLGESSKAGKAAAAAASLINTYQGITAELATKTATPFGFALKLVNIASTAAIGFKSVKDILKTNPKSASGGASNPAAGAGGAPTTEPVPPTAAIPPEFNTVGAGSTNQLADAIGGQSQQPIQTYVVSGEVSTSQELERNIVTGATIG